MVEKLKGIFLQNRGTRHTVVKNVFWLSMSQIVGRLIRASVIVYAARVLGTEGYGIFSYALGLASFFTIFADIGVGTILTREVSQKPAQAPQYFATAFWIKVALISITALAVVFIAPYVSNVAAVYTLLPLIALLIIFDNLREFCVSYFRAQEKMEREAFVNLITNVAITAFGFVVLFYSKTSEALAVSYVSSAGIGMLASIYILRKEFSYVVANFRKEMVKEILTAAWPVALFGILGSFMINIDIVMLGWLKSAHDIGLYSSGQRIVQILYLLPTILGSSTFPSVSRFVGSGDHERIGMVTERIMSFVLLMALPLVVGGIVLGEPIIAFLFGSEYVAGAISFKILVATTMFVFPTIALGNLVIVFDRQRKMMGYIAITALSNLLLNAFLIPPLGIVGAALATLTVQIMYAFLMWQTSKRLVPLHLFRYLKKITVASLAMGVMAFFLQRMGLHVLITIALSGTAYFGLLYMMKERLIDEIRDIGTAMKNA
ncbi:MAG: flippase [Candidatus Brennerbacteria bacterium]